MLLSNFKEILPASKRTLARNSQNLFFVCCLYSLFLLIILTKYFDSFLNLVTSKNTAEIETQDKLLVYTYPTLFSIFFTPFSIIVPCLILWQGTVVLSNKFNRVFFISIKIIAIMSTAIHFNCYAFSIFNVHKDLMNIFDSNLKYGETEYLGVVDSVQKTLDCCGKETPSDWFNQMKHGQPNFHHIPKINMSDKQGQTTVNLGSEILLPSSCCDDSTPQFYEPSDNPIPECTIDAFNVRKKGCDGKLTEWLHSIWLPILVVHFASCLFNELLQIFLIMIAPRLDHSASNAKTPQPFYNVNQNSSRYAYKKGDLFCNGESCNNGGYERFMNCFSCNFNNNHNNVNDDNNNNNNNDDDNKNNNGDNYNADINDNTDNYDHNDNDDDTGNTIEKSFGNGNEYKEDDYDEESDDSDDESEQNSCDENKNNKKNFKIQNQNNKIQNQNNKIHINNNSNQYTQNNNYENFQKFLLKHEPSKDVTSKTQILPEKKEAKKDKKYSRVVKKCGKLFGKKKLKIRPSSGLVGVLLNSQTPSGVGNEKNDEIDNDGMYGGNQWGYDRGVNNEVEGEGRSMGNYSSKGQAMWVKGHEMYVKDHGMGVKGHDICTKGQEKCIKCQQIWAKYQKIILENQRIQKMKEIRELQNLQNQQIQNVQNQHIQLQQNQQIQHLKNQRIQNLQNQQQNLQNQQQQQLQQNQQIQNHQMQNLQNQQLNQQLKTQQNQQTQNNQTSKNTQVTNTKPPPQKPKTTNPFDDDYESVGDSVEYGTSCQADGGGEKAPEISKPNCGLERENYTNDPRSLQVHLESGKTLNVHGVAGMSNDLNGKFGTPRQVSGQDGRTTEAYREFKDRNADERRLMSSYRDGMRHRKTTEPLKNDTNRRKIMEYLNNGEEGMKTRETKSCRTNNGESKNSCRLKYTDSFRIDSMADITKRKEREISNLYTKNGSQLKFFKVNCSNYSESPNQYNKDNVTNIQYKKLPTQCNEKKVINTNYKKFPNQYNGDKVTITHYKNIPTQYNTENPTQYNTDKTTNTSTDHTEHTISNTSNRYNNEGYRMNNIDFKNLKLDSIFKIRGSLSKYSLFSKKGRNNLKSKIASLFGRSEVIPETKEDTQEKDSTKAIWKKLIGKKKPKDPGGLSKELAKLKEEMMEKKMECAMEYEEKISNITDKWYSEVIDVMKRYREVPF